MKIALVSGKLKGKKETELKIMNGAKAIINGKAVKK